MDIKANIIIAENDGIVARDIENILIKLGYTVLATVFSGEEALVKAEEHKPDLVISEVKLNGKMNGIDASDQIQSRLNIPVVFLTAITDKYTIKKIKLVRPYGFVIKPFEEEMLQATIEMALYRNMIKLRGRKASEEKTRSTKMVNIPKTSEAGLRDDWTRATFIVKKEQLQKLKDIAYWDRKKVKEVVEEAFEIYLKDKDPSRHSINDNMKNPQITLPE